MEVNGCALFIMISSALSLVGSFSVVLTALVFPLLRRKLFMRIIAMISLCDFFASIASILGYNQTGFICQLQGALYGMFYRASWIWTVAFSYELYGVITSSPQKLPISEPNLHIICWSIALLLESVPYWFGAKYGGSGVICSFHGPYFVVLMISLFFSILVICCILTVSLYYSLSKYLDMNRETLGEGVFVITSVLRQYPSAMVICWIPNIILNFVDMIYPSPLVETSLNASLGVGGLYGFLIAGIFFSNSIEARTMWSEWFLFLIGKGKIRSISNISAISSQYQESIPTTRSSVNAAPRLEELVTDAEVLVVNPSLITLSHIHSMMNV